MILSKKMYIVAIVLAIFVAFGCSDSNADFIGTWRRIPEGDSLYRGFTLGSHGIALSLNQTTTQYNTWHHKRDTLWLSGKRFTDTSVFPFTDTLIIKKITVDSLVLQKDNEYMHFGRE